MKVETTKVISFSLTDEEKNSLSSVIKLLREIANEDDCLCYAVESEICEDLSYLEVTLEGIKGLDGIKMSI